MPPDGQPANFPQPKKPTEPVHPAHNDFQRVHDHSTMGVIAINADGLICYANAAALANTGLLKDELIGRPLFGIYHSTSTDQDNQARILGMEEITDQEFTVKSDASAEQWALISSKVYRDAEGTVQTYLFIRDISALKKREKLFSYLNKAA